MIPYLINLLSKFNICFLFYFLIYVNYLGCINTCDICEVFIYYLFFILFVSFVICLIFIYFIDNSIKCCAFVRLLGFKCYVYECVRHMFKYVFRLY